MWQCKDIAHILLWQRLLSYCSFDYFHCFNSDRVSGDSFVLKYYIEDTFLGDRKSTKNVVIKFS